MLYSSGRRFACPAGFKYDEENGGCTKKHAKVTEEETLGEHLVDEDERWLEPNEEEEEEEEINPNKNFERPISSYRDKTQKRSSPRKNKMSGRLTYRYTYGKIYKLVERKMTWKDAEKHCATRNGGHLVTITSPTVNKKVGQVQP